MIAEVPVSLHQPWEEAQALALMLQEVSAGDGLDGPGSEDLMSLLAGSFAAHCTNGWLPFQHLHAAAVARESAM